MKVAILALALVCLGCQPNADPESAHYVRHGELKALEERVEKLETEDKHILDILNDLTKQPAKPTTHNANPCPK